MFDSVDEHIYVMFAWQPSCRGQAQIRLGWLVVDSRGILDELPPWKVSMLTC